jgi:ATP-dependent HslUV protease subunit HslV
MSQNVELFRATTVLCIRKNGKVVMAADGQVSYGNTILKATGKKIKLLENGKVLVGFAGSVSDCLTLVDRLESKLDKFHDVERAAFELAKEWRIDKYIKDLEAHIIVASQDHLLILNGSGNIVDPEDNIASVGSGSMYAISAAKALYYNTDFSAEEIVKISMKVAADTCVYTNHNITIHTIQD